MNRQRFASSCAGLLAAGLLLACPSQPESGDEQALTPTAPAAGARVESSDAAVTDTAQAEGQRPRRPASAGEELPVAPAPVVGSVLDEVDVMGADEAALEAERAIGDGNVLDVLDELEKEIEAGGN